MKVLLILKMSILNILRSHISDCILSRMFVESNCAFYSINTCINYDDFIEYVNSFDTTNHFYKEKKVNIGLGLAAGKKWKTQTHWVFEFNLGLGRNLSYDKYNYYYGGQFEEKLLYYIPELELSIGKRF